MGSRSLNREGHGRRRRGARAVRRRERDRVAAFHGERVIEGLACSDRSAADAVGPDQLWAGDRNAVRIASASGERDGGVRVTRLGPRVKDDSAGTWIARVVELLRSGVGVTLAGVFGRRLPTGAGAGAAGATAAAAARSRRAGGNASARETLEARIAGPVCEARPALRTCDGAGPHIGIGSAARDGDGHQRSKRHGKSFHAHTPDGIMPSLQDTRGGRFFATVTGSVTHGAFAWDVGAHS